MELTGAVIRSARCDVPSAGLKEKLMNKGRAFISLLFSLLLGLLLLVGVVAHGMEAAPPSVYSGPPVLKVGLVIDENGLDEIWNELPYLGLLRAETEIGISGTVYTPTGSSDYAAKVQQCVTDGNDLCLTSSWLMGDITQAAANGNPNTKFAILDVSYDSYPGNLRGIIFKSEEAGYLAGTLAGLMSQSHVIGDIGGMPIPPVDAFVHGYRNGAQCANPRVTVLIDYAGTFGDPELGAAMAQAMIAQGADVIFAPAGPTGTGAVMTATQSGVWGIGVDFDYYDMAFGAGTVPGADKLLSSAVKHFDNAVYRTISDTVQSAFTAGTVVYGLEEAGVGLAPFHEADPMVPQPVRDALDTARVGLISGSVNVEDGCRTYLYLPQINR